MAQNTAYLLFLDNHPCFTYFVTEVEEGEVGDLEQASRPATTAVYSFRG